jgi:simple sugar transport system ATP-binding protein
MQVLSGERQLRGHGALRLDGKDVGHLGPAERRALGLCSVPEDRLGEGSVPTLSLAENVLLTANRGGATRTGLIRFDWIESFAKRCIAAFDVRCSGPAAQAASLSGGNLQKFIVGREILQDPGVLVIAQPTWGVDVGAAMVIRQALLDLRDKGAAILVVSEELDELFEIADRIAVIAGGHLSEGVARDATNRDQIGLAMTSGHLPSAAATGGAHAAAF